MWLGSWGREWSGQGVAWGAGDQRRHVGGINSGGLMSGERTGRPGRLPLSLAGGVVVAQGSSHRSSLRDGRVKGSDLGGTRMSQATAMAQRGLALGRSGSGKLLAASGPILCSRVSFALLGIDPQRPLVDSLIEN